MQDFSKIPSSIRYLALFTAILTWFLILVGGIVHGTGSSLACPDWPTCYGTFFPEMKGGIFFEHSHRIVATLTGFFTVLLCVLLLAKGQGALRKAGIAAVALVIFQGILGGITVLYRLPTAVSTAHLATSMVFLCLMSGIAYVAFSKATDKNPQPLVRLKPWLLSTLVLVYLQILLGALVRHTGAGLACLEIPLCQGSLWPSGAPPILQVHMLHRVLGAIVGLLVCVTSWRVYRVVKDFRVLRFLAVLAPCLVLAQVGLGLWSVHSALALFPVTSHLGVGACLLVVFFLMNLSVAQALRRAAGAEARGALPKGLRPSAA